MPRVKSKRPKFKDTDVVIAWQAVAVDTPEGEFTIARGTRLRGSHPAVKAATWCFAADGTPDEEIPKPPAPDPQPHVPEFYRPAPRIPDEEAAVCVTAFTAGRRHVAKGQRLRRDDPLVQANAELFRTPPMPVGKAG